MLNVISNWRNARLNQNKLPLHTLLMGEEHDAWQYRAFGKHGEQQEEPPYCVCGSVSQ